MSKLVKGKMPISQKRENSDFANEDLDFNPLKLDPELKKELAEQGLVGRFLNARQLQENYGFHKSGWQVYKRKGSVAGAGAFKFGQDPEGHVRYRDLILGVKPAEEQARWKAKLAASNRRKTAFNQQAANELREMARQAGAEIKVHEGFDYNGENDTDGDED
jgi:hypothetical protein